LVLNNDQIIQYLRRCYTWVDGFWFLEVERHLDSFEKALEIDTHAWIKITRQQAKLAHKLLNCSTNDIPATFETLKVKWLVDGHSYEIQEMNTSQGTVIIHKCPWFETLKRSGREHLAGNICSTVCPPLYRTWTTTINPNIQVKIVNYLGKGAEACELRFNQQVSNE